MFYPKIVASGAQKDVQENTVRFLKKNRSKILWCKTTDPIFNKVIDEHAKIDVSTHQVTLQIMFWFWVKEDEREEILNQSTAKYASFNEAFGIPEPDFIEGEAIDKDKQYF